MNKPSALSFLAIFLLLWPFGYIIHAQAAPIEFGITDNRVKDPHYEENLNRIDEAAASAQWQIENVLHFLDPANRHLYNDYDKNIRNAYGDPTKVNVEAIRKTFEGLRDQKLHIGNMHAHKSTMHHQKAMAQINLEEKTVRLHHDFHDPNNTPELLPGILIHEASHAVGSFDWFNKKNAEIKGHHEQKSETEDLNPYLSNPKDFKEAKRLIPHKIHLNADSHRLLAHTVSFGWNVPVQPDPKSARKWNKTQDTYNEQVVVDAAGKTHHLKGLTVEMRGKTTKKELECHNKEVPEGNVAALCKIRKIVPIFKYRHKNYPAYEQPPAQAVASASNHPQSASPETAGWAEVHATSSNSRTSHTHHPAAVVSGTGSHNLHSAPPSSALGEKESPGPLGASLLSSHSAHTRKGERTGTAHAFSKARTHKSERQSKMKKISLASKGASSSELREGKEKSAKDFGRTTRKSARPRTSIASVKPSGVPPKVKSPRTPRVSNSKPGLRVPIDIERKGAPNGRSSTRPQIHQGQTVHSKAPGTPAKSTRGSIKTMPRVPVGSTLRVPSISISRHSRASSTVAKGRGIAVPPKRRKATAVLRGKKTPAIAPKGRMASSAAPKKPNFSNHSRLSKLAGTKSTSTQTGRPRQVSSRRVIRGQKSSARGTPTKHTTQPPAKKKKSARPPAHTRQVEKGIAKKAAPLTKPGRKH